MKDASSSSSKPKDKSSKSSKTSSSSKKEKKAVKSESSSSSKDKKSESSKTKSSKSERSKKEKSSKSDSRSKSRKRDTSRSKSRSRRARKRRRRDRSRDRDRDRKRRRRGRSRDRSHHRSRRKKTPPPPVAPVKITKIELSDEQKKELKREQFLSQIKAMNESVNAQVTRPARKLYVGNLPTDMVLTEKMLIEFFAACLEGLGVMTEVPIISCWINGDQTFAFLELRSVQDTSLALVLFEGLTLGGRQLRFGRAVDYKIPENHLLCYLVGGPEALPGQEVPYQMPQVKR
eukprot:UN23475